MDLGIAGRIALITGGSKGIGRAISMELAEAGAKVIVVARGQQAIDDTVAAIMATGATAIGISADLSKLESYDELLEEAVHRLGPPDIAVYNMETPLPGRFEDFEEKDFEHAFHIVVLCYMRMVRRVLPHMKQQRWGRIVTIGSGSAKQPVRGHLNFAYALSNTTRVAAVGMVKTIAAEVAPFNVMVNTIATGAIETDQAMAWMRARANELAVPTSEFVGNMNLHIPLARFGKPSEIAALCAYLCSNRLYTTAETILCDGGLSNVMP